MFAVSELIPSRSLERSCRSKVPWYLAVGCSTRTVSWIPRFHTRLETQAVCCWSLLTGWSLLTDQPFSPPALWPAVIEFRTMQIVSLSVSLHIQRAWPAADLSLHPPAPLLPLLTRPRCAGLFLPVLTQSKPTRTSGPWHLLYQVVRTLSPASHKSSSFLSSMSHLMLLP